MRICAAGIAMCLAVAYLTVAPAAASASCGTRGNYFDGMGYLPSVPGVTQWYFRGAGANVVTRVNSLCSSIGTVENFTDAWVMVAARDSRGWAQVGYEMNAVLGSSPRYFAQQYRGDGCPSTYSWCYSTTYWPGGPALNSDIKIDVRCVAGRGLRWWLAEHSLAVPPVDEFGAYALGRARADEHDIF